MLGTSDVPGAGRTRPRAGAAPWRPRPSRVLRVPRLEADSPNQCWTWDITKLAGPTRPVRYFLYTIIDIFSRAVVGWTIAERESEKIARRLITETCRTEGVDRDTLTIHADRGGPMIAGTVAELLNDLGITKSHSRPRVSNDNPFIEAHFKTLKYRPDYPDRFASIGAAEPGAGGSSAGTTRSTTTPASATYAPPTSTPATTPPSSPTARQRSTPPTPPTPSGSPPGPRPHR